VYFPNKQRKAIGFAILSISEERKFQGPSRGQLNEM